MPTVEAMIKHLMPNGTRWFEEGSAIPPRPTWKAYPLWPPDAFAVAATLLEIGGWYPVVSGPQPEPPFDKLRERTSNSERVRLEEIGAAWRSGIWYTRKRSQAKELAGRLSGQLEPERILDVKEIELQQIWDALHPCTVEVDDRSGFKAWAYPALQLLIIADEASAGLGHYGSQHPPTFISYLYQDRALGRPGSVSTSSGGETVKQRLAPTACRSVPASTVCVQPKARTPTVGCSIRSLSKHLALLPPQGQVRAPWNPLIGSFGSSHAFKVLVVPFPYKISGLCFRADEAGHRPPSSIAHGYFSIDQRWLSAVTKDLNEIPEKLTKTIEDLITCAEDEVGEIDALIFPEMSLDEPCYIAISTMLRRRFARRFGFFIAGVKETTPSSPQYGNTARTTVYYPGTDDAQTTGESIAGFISARQYKHHRWKVDRSQIVQYSIGDRLDPKKVWWENVAIGERDLPIYVFSEGSCFTTLICEDLARIDPCQSVIRAIGPNLVIALLMDGPQVRQRWSARYAMALADDPGCSVLSVTSLGLIERSNVMNGSTSRVVALWRDCTGETRELALPPGHQAIVLSLTSHAQEEWTLDGRRNADGAHYWTLTGYRPIRLAPAPEWFDAS